MINLKKICEFPLNLKIISFFQENPQTLDTSRGLATWLNHERGEIKKALDFLVSQEILVAHRTRSTIAYAYTQNKEIINQIKKFLANK